MGIDELVIENLEAGINHDRFFISVLETDHDLFGCQELDIKQAIQLRDHLNKFIGENNE